MTLEHILALDQGTTSSRALVIAADGTVVGRAALAHRQHFPRPGWVEHDPEELWTNLKACAQRALTTAGCTVADLLAIGLTNQRETSVVWERATGRPLQRAIVWQDRRTEGACRALRDAGYTSMVRGRTGLELDPYFSATKFAWMLDHNAGARIRAARGELCVGTVDAWICERLSGSAYHRSEPTNASRTSLYSLEDAQWDEELLALFDVGREVLPELVDGAAPMLERGATDALFGEEGPPLTGVLGDQQAALFAQGCFRPGEAKATFGTGTFVLGACGSTLPMARDGLLTTVAGSAFGGRAYALEGAILSSGGALSWLVQLGLVPAPSATEGLARSLTGNDDVWFVPALSGLGAPYWDANARGTLLGVTAKTTAAHVARAVLEGIAHETVDVLDAMARAGRPVEVLRVDGGVAANRWLMAHLSDISGVVVDVSQELETTALGVGYLAGIRAGLWRDEEEIRSLRRSASRYEPTFSEDHRRTLRVRWGQARERAAHWNDEHG